LDILENDPLDTLSARRSGEGTFVSVVFNVVLGGKEVLNIDIVDVDNGGIASR